MNLRYLCICLLPAVLFLPASAQQKLTLEESVLGQFGQFAPQTMEQLDWIKGSDSYFYIKDNVLILGKVKGKGQESNLFTLQDLNTWKGGDAMKSFPEINWTSLSTFWFQQGNAFYDGDLKAKKVTLQGEYPADAANTDHHAATHRVAYTKDNNLYAVFEKGKSAIQITNNKKDIVSGQSISRNEYGITKGTFWNNQGNKLAFYQKDETNVTNYPLVNYKNVPAAVREIKYPFAGAQSELVSVGVYDMASAKTVFLDLDKGQPNDQFYATNLGWGPDGNTIYLAILNRASTDMELKAFDASTGKEIKTLFTEHSDKWLEPEHPVAFVPGKDDHFLWFSQRSGNNNLYLYKTDGTLVKSTSVKWEINEILGYDMPGENVFVMGTGEVPTESMCFKIKLADMSIAPVSQVHGAHFVSISHSGEFAIDGFSNLTTPHKIDLISTSGRLVKNLLNAPDPYAAKVIGKTELFTLKAKDGTDLWCRLIKPSNFDPSKKYPVLVYVYGGPHAQLVTNSYLGGASLWMHYLAEQGFLVFTLDNHGSGNRGHAWEHVIHRHLGSQEIEDQLLGVEWLKKQSFVNADKMALHGWSYGGFMTTSMMLKRPGTFKVAVAGGPVIDWSLYEVMYGERYMDTPQENPEGYKETDLTGYVKNLQGKLLMIHGTDDDVVVMQHNMKFMKACVDNKVQVDFFAYPGHAHNVRGKDRVHLMDKVIRYVMDEVGTN